MAVKCVYYILKQKTLITLRFTVVIYDTLTTQFMENNKTE